METQTTRALGGLTGWPDFLPYANQNPYTHTQYTHYYPSEGQMFKDEVKVRQVVSVAGKLKF